MLRSLDKYIDAQTRYQPPSERAPDIPSHLQHRHSFYGWRFNAKDFQEQHKEEELELNRFFERKAQEAGIHSRLHVLYGPFDPPKNEGEQPQYVAIVWTSRNYISARCGGLSPKPLMNCPASQCIANFMRILDIEQPTWFALCEGED